MTFLFICLLLQSAQGADEVENAKKSLQALIQTLVQKPSKENVKTAIGEFSVENCEKHKINWTDAILLRTETRLNYTFKAGCDIEGSITPKIIKPFRADLKLRNLKDFKNLESENKIWASLEAKPIMNLEVRKAALISPMGKVIFEADYAVRMDPFKKGSAMGENLGGEIRVSEIYGKKVSIKEKILIK